MQEVSMNKDMKLSEHFTLGELTKTNHKTEDQNIPSRVAIENLRNLCENWLEDLRYSYNKGRLLPARLCRLACPRTGRKKHRYL